MCDQPENSKRRFTGLAARRRLKLWELKPQFHCAILGTCLTMDDLRKVMPQSGVELAGKPSDYDLHATLVSQAEENGRATRNLQKMLDRKYKRWIQALARCRESAELEQCWRTAMESGDIAGSFWAIVTHPYADAELVRQSYEDVHMLSHLQGASNRADLKRMKVLEAEVRDLKETFDRLRRNASAQIARRDELLRRQEQELLAAMVRDSRRWPEKNEARARDELRKQNQVLAKRVDWAESQLAQREMQMAELQEELAGLKELLHETREEHTAMEQTMTLLLAERGKGETEQGRAIDLRGKRILYVGGRSALAPHLRSLVEAHNGRFDHHDGGLEDSRAGLQYTLAAADMVFCPTDCISHDACRRVKRHCQQQSKQFIPLRSSGLSTFAAGLRRFSAARDEQGLGG